MRKRILVFNLNCRLADASHQSRRNSISGKFESTSLIAAATSLSTRCHMPVVNQIEEYAHLHYYLANEATDRCSPYPSSMVISESHGNSRSFCGLHLVSHHSPTAHLNWMSGTPISHACSWESLAKYCVSFPNTMSSIVCLSRLWPLVFWQLTCLYCSNFFSLQRYFQC